jgi:hypothetical protein
MIDSIPFVYRFLFLLFVLSVIAWFDWLKYRAAARRWKEYCFILGVGMIGVAFAIIVDTFTSKISPEYFIYGKGVPLGHDFYLRILGLAIEVGFSGGIVAGGAYLLANSAGRGKSGLPFSALLKLLWIPLVFAIALAAPMSWFCLKYDPKHLREELEFIRPAEAGERFIMVWGVHAGLYIGALLGIAIGALIIRRKLKQLPEPAAQDKAVA